MKYKTNFKTYDRSIDHQTVDVMPGGEMETPLVYLVKGKPHMATLSYDNLSGPTLTRISHYDHSHEYRDGSYH